MNTHKYIHTCTHTYTNTKHAHAHVYTQHTLILVLTLSIRIIWSPTTKEAKTRSHRHCWTAPSSMDKAPSTLPPSLTTFILYSSMQKWAFPHHRKFTLSDKQFCHFKSPVQVHTYTGYRGVARIIKRGLPNVSADARCRGLTAPKSLSI